MDVFDQSLQRIVEMRDLAEADGLEPYVHVNICGLGEPLLHKQLPEMVKKLRGAGFGCGISTNAGLLDEKRSQMLIDAGVTSLNINIGDVGEAYEEVYKLDFDKTLANVLRFKEMSGGEIDMIMVLVNYKNDAEHVKSMIDFWHDQGLPQTISFEIMNRGGALEVDHMAYESFPELQQARDIFAAMDGPRPVCGAPFAFHFIGYDGQYYLCCSDWRKEAPLGSVFDESLLSIIGEKHRLTLDRSKVCKSCNLDPTNQLTEQLRLQNEGGATQEETDAFIATLDDQRNVANEVIETLASTGSRVGVGQVRKRIPVQITTGD